MKNVPFRGVSTAIVTPMTSSGEVDVAAFLRLIEYQIEGGISALTVCGTTGEASTLSPREMHYLIRTAVESAEGRIPIIAGAGSNDTSRACYLAESAEAAGAAAILSVVPYYVKPGADGIIRHFDELSKASSLPVILYNVPSRTGVNIPFSVYRALSENPRIAALKEASGDVDYACRFLSEFGNRFALYSGNDSLNLPLYALGAEGAISVLSNVRPREVADVFSLFDSGKTDGARRLHLSLSPLAEALFREPNPIPVKAALSLMGLCENYLRLPLTPAREETVEILKKFI